LLGLVGRTISLPARAGRPKRRENLPQGDADIPASVLYGSVVRALGQLGDRNTLDFILRASGDFDPYVRIQALDALKRVDPTGEFMSSRVTAREALNDPADGVVRAACQLIITYRDRDATPYLQNLSMTRPALAPIAYDALRQLG
jgi:HEAT repeat protein